MTKRRVSARVAPVVMVLAMAGCSSMETRDDDAAAPVVKAPPPASTPAPAKPPQPPARPPQPSVSSAWLPLVRKAEQATARGDYEQALALLERAQRIDPESGEIYLQLARTHQARGDAAQARATAERGMLYCGSSAQCAALRTFTQ